ncbi:hypothetical protein E2C01_051069 [Portunus trituberculatus]|uniref:Uncharacterized protein n=1 Tax=Portunus trituberculatus TaxID=210409 RepID=A0A5B7GHM4_PORTR|nr:hypothetical protein [Portunus trituberculatus]
MKHGYDERTGCRLACKCSDAYPKMCNASLQKRECMNKKCTYMHIKCTKRKYQFPQEQPYGAKHGQSTGIKKNAIKNIETPEAAKDCRPRNKMEICKWGCERCTFFKQNSGKPGRAAETDAKNDAVYDGKNEVARQVKKRVLQSPLNLIKFITGSIRGLYPRCNQNKVLLLQEITEQDKLSFIALKETHLHEEIIDAEININNFSIYRTDRKD